MRCACGGASAGAISIAAGFHRRPDSRRRSDSGACDGQVPARQRSHHLALLPGGDERHRRRLHVLQSRHRSCAADRGDGSLGAGRAQVPQDDPVPAREHRDPHGRRGHARDRARAGGDGSRGRGHRQHRDGRAQPAARSGAGAPDRRQGTAFGARRTRRFARQLCALHPGTARSGRNPAQLREVGVDAAIGRDHQGGAAARALGCVQRPVWSGVPDAAARNPGRGMGRAGRPLLPRRALRCGEGGHG